MDTETYILTIDQSTSGTKGILVNHKGLIVARHHMEHTQYYPEPGWVEHDPVEIYDNVKTIIQQLLLNKGIHPSRLAAITITNQRETALIWDRTTGLPIYPAIVWQCQRTAEVCGELAETDLEEMVRAKTGLMLDPYFSATKFRWILDHVPQAGELLRQGRLLAGTIDAWLVWKLSGGTIHATDYTNASRTLLYNIHELSWDEELTKCFGVPREILPKVQASDEPFGCTNDPELFPEHVPITGIMGDSQAALYGQRCFAPGMAKATYGTGTSLLMNIGHKPVDPKNGLVLTIAWGRDKQITYALEGVIRTSGDSIKWLRDHMGMFENYKQLEQLTQSVKDSEGVYVVPAFGGLGAPYWDADARAAFLGMNRSTQKSHILRAALDSIAYQVKDVFEIVSDNLGMPLRELRADGGASTNETLMQFQADMLDCDVVVSEISELSAMGSTYMGGVAAGFWSSPDLLPVYQNNERLYRSSMEPDAREQYYNGWKKAVSAILT